MNPLLIEHLPPSRRSLRLAVVTETYPPEVNGVALTLARFVEGLLARNHEIQLIRPRQTPAEQVAEGDGFGKISEPGGLDEVLMGGVPIPRYPNLRIGLPAKWALLRQWTLRRPDLVHIVTEGPLGWSALHAALKLKIPVCSDFRTNFHAYSLHYAIFAGVRHGEDLAAHYASGDLFLFPSLTETFGNVTVEAMTSGLPVVAFNYAAAAQYVQHETSGLLADYGRTADFASMAGQLAARHSYEVERFRAMGRKARLTAEPLDWKRVVQQQESLLFSIV